jgi:hypothetical protein
MTIDYISQSLTINTQRSHYCVQNLVLHLEIQSTRWTGIRSIIFHDLNLMISLFLDDG